MQDVQLLDAIERFLRPVSFQNFPDTALPDQVREANPAGLRRLVDGAWVWRQRTDQLVLV